MGIRFRKSFKVAPGVKVNLNKKSSSVTFGGKGAHYTINSKGKRTTSVGIPGTGLYYTDTSTNKQSKQTKQSKDTATRSIGNTGSTNSNNRKNMGCLNWLLIIILICLAISLYSYCWILAIPALIYFLTSKKYQDQKVRNATICGAVLITSLLVFSWLNAPKELNSLDVDWGSDEFYIGDTVELNITGNPSDAKIDTLELSKNNIAKLKYSDGKAIITFTDDGVTPLFFTANGTIKSNTEKITVIDKAAEEAERLAAEKAAAEEAERLAAEKATAEEAERLAAEKAAEEAERLAAEQAAAEEAERLASEQAAATQVVTEQPSEPQEPLVWIPATGSKYHTNAGCSGMNNPQQVPLSEAQNMGYTPCKRCH